MGFDVPELNYTDTYWDDLTFSVTRTRQGANQKPDFNETKITLEFPQNNAAEILYIADQMSHKYKEGSEIWPHVHWQQSASTNPVFKMDYQFYNPGDAIPAGWTTYEMSTKVFPYTSGTLAQISRGAAAISLPSMKVSFLMKIKFYRQDNVVTGDVHVDCFDIHFQSDSPGSRQEYIK